MTVAAIILFFALLCPGAETPEKEEEDGEESDSFPSYEITVIAPKSILHPVVINPLDKEKEIGLTNDVYELPRNLPGLAASGQKSRQFSVQGSDDFSNLMVLNGAAIEFPSHLDMYYPRNASVLNMESVRSLGFYAAAPPAEYGFKTASIMEVEYGAVTEPFEADVSFSTLDFTALAKGRGRGNIFSAGFRHGLYYNIMHLDNRLNDFKGNEAGYDNFQLFAARELSGWAKLEAVWINSVDRVGATPGDTGSPDKFAGSRVDADFSTDVQIRKRAGYSLINSRLTLMGRDQDNVKVIYGRETSSDATDALTTVKSSLLGQTLDGVTYSTLRKTDEGSTSAHHVRAVGEHRWKGHLLSSGIEAHYMDTRSSREIAADFPAVVEGVRQVVRQRVEGGLFAEDRVEMSKTWEVRAGARLDRYFSQGVTCPSTKAALQYNGFPDQGLYVKAGNYNQSFPAQSPKDGVTRAWHGLFGWEWRNFLEAQVFNVEAFIKREKDVPDVRANPVLFEFDGNTHSQTICGVTPSLSLEPFSGAEWALNYTYLYPYSVGSDRVITTVRPHTFKSQFRCGLGRERKFNVLFKTLVFSGLPYGFQRFEEGRLVEAPEHDRRFPSAVRWDLGMYMEESVPGLPLKKARVYYNLSNSKFILPQTLFAWTPGPQPEQILLEMPPQYFLELGIKLKF